MRVRLRTHRSHVLSHDRGALCQAQIKRNPVRLRDPRICEREIQRIVSHAVIGRQRTVRNQKDLIIAAHVRHDRVDAAKAIRETVARITDWKVEPIIALPKDNHVLARSVEQQVVTGSSSKDHLKIGIRHATGIQYVITASTEYLQRGLADRQRIECAV